MNFTRSPDYSAVAGAQGQGPRTVPASPATLAERLRKIELSHVSHDISNVPSYGWSAGAAIAGAYSSPVDLRNLSMQHALILEEKTLELEQRDVLLRRSQETIYQLREEASALRIMVSEIPKLRSDFEDLLGERDALRDALSKASKQREIAVANERQVREEADSAATRARDVQIRYENEMRESAAKLKQEAEANDMLDVRIRHLVDDLANEKAEKEALISEKFGQQQMYSERLADSADSIRKIDEEAHHAKSEINRLQGVLDVSTTGAIELMKEVETYKRAVASLESQLQEKDVLSEQATGRHLRREQDLTSQIKRVHLHIETADEELTKKDETLQELEEDALYLRGRLAQMEEDQARLMASKESAQEESRRKLEKALADADEESNARLHKVVRETEDQCRKACEQVEERTSKMAHTHSLELARVQTDLSTALRLCRQYEEALQLVMSRIEEACIVHLGGISAVSGGIVPVDGDDKAVAGTSSGNDVACLIATEFEPTPTDSRLSRAMSSSSKALGKLNRSMGRILRRLAAAQQLREYFERAVSSIYMEHSKAVADLHQKYEKDLGRLRLAETNLTQLQEAVKYSRRRAALVERESCFKKIDALEDEKRALRTRLSNAEAELAVLHSHIKHLKQGKSDEEEEVEVATQELKVRLLRRTEEVDALTKELVDKEVGLAHETARWMEERDSLAKDITTLQKKLSDMEQTAAQQLEDLKEALSQRDSAVAMEDLVVREIEQTRSLLRKRAENGVEGDSNGDSMDDGGGIQSSTTGSGEQDKDRSTDNARKRADDGTDSDNHLSALHNLCAELACLVHATGAFYEDYKALRELGGQEARETGTLLNRLKSLDDVCFQLLDRIAQLSLQMQSLVLDYQRLLRTTHVSRHMSVDHLHTVQPAQSPRTVMKEKSGSVYSFTSPMRSSPSAISPSAVYGRAILTPRTEQRRPIGVATPNMGSIRHEKGWMSHVSPTPSRHQNGLGQPPFTSSK